MSFRITRHWKPLALGLLPALALGQVSAARHHDTSRLDTAAPADLASHWTVPADMADGASPALQAPEQVTNTPTVTPTSTVTPTRTPTPTPSPTNSPPLTPTPAVPGAGFPSLAPGRAVALPVIGGGGGQGLLCSVWIQVQNVGSAATTAALVVWGEDSPCEDDIGPLGVVCSGLLSPGSAWAFNYASLPPGLASGFVYALADGDYGPLPIANTLCASLANLSTGGAYRDFHAAYLGDGSVAGIPMSAARGEPLAATVHRTCQADLTAGRTVSGAYEGISDAMLAARDAAQSPQYRYEVPLVPAESAGMNSLLYVQNAGLECAAVELRFRAEGSCAPAGGGFDTLAVAPGQARVVEPLDYVDWPWRGSAEILSDVPLAVTADVYGLDSLSTYRGVPAVPSPGADRLFGPLYHSPETGWDTVVQVQNLGSSTTAARVTFHRADGTVEATLTNTICAGASKPFMLPVSFDSPTLQPGWIQVESECGGGTAPEPLAAVAWLLKYSDIARSEVREASAYNLLAAPELGAGTVGLPFTFKDLSASGLTSEIQVAAGPEFGTGSTGTESIRHTFAVSSTVAQYDLALGAGRSVYQNLEAMSGISNALRAAALLDDVSQRARYAAVGMIRTGARLGEDRHGDEAAAYVGVPVGALPASVPSACTPSCAPLAPGLVAWWRAEGNAEDSGPSGAHDGTLVGGATATGAGRVGQAFDLDGTGYVAIPTDAALNPPGSFSIEGWLYVIALNGQFHVLTKWGDAGAWSDERAFAFHTTSELGMQFAISDAALQHDADFHAFASEPNVVPLNAWTHVAGVYDQSTGTRHIYVNGTQVAERTDPPITLTASIADAAIGAHLAAPGGANDLSVGRVDEVAFYHQALTADQVFRAYAAGAEGHCRPAPPCLAPGCRQPARVIPVRNLPAPPRLNAPVDCGVAPRSPGIGLVPGACDDAGPPGPDLSSSSLRWGSGATVNVATGELIVSEVDLAIAGRGFDFRLERRYGSGAAYDGPLGHGWDLNLGRRLLEVNTDNAAAYGAAVGAPLAPGDVLRMDGTGRAELFQRQPDGSYTAPDGSFDVLQAAGDGGLIERDAAGSMARFAAPDAAGAAPMTAVTDRAGNTMRFRYDAAGRLTRVLDTLGRPVDFGYDAEGRLTAVRDFAGRQVSYGYDAHGHLVKVTSPAVTGTSTGNDFPAGKTTRFAYTSGSPNPALNGNLVAVTAPNEVAAGGPPRLVVEYDGADRVRRFTTGGTNASGVPAGGRTTYDYAALAPAGPPEPDPVVRETRMLDANGNAVTYGFNARGQVRQVQRHTNRDIRPDEVDAYVDTYRYDAEGRMVRHERPAGNAMEYLYDNANPDRRQQGNLLEVRAIADAARGADQGQVRTTFRYEPLFNQVAAVVDPRGNGPYTPPNGGAASPARYTTRLTFDYQEGDNAAALGQLLGLPEATVRARLAAAGVALNLGDVNGDGRTDQVAGKIVRLDRPTVALEPAGPLAQRLGNTVLPSFELYGYNRHGQLLYQVDAEGNLDRYEYYPENDPDGDGRDLTPGLTTARFGYLAALTRDARPRPAPLPPFSWIPPTGDTAPREPLAPAWRNGGVPGAFAEIRDELRYDRLGRLIRHNGPRGVVGTFEVNALGQVVSQAQAAAVTVDRANREEPAWARCRDATLPECGAGMVAFNVRSRLFYDGNDNLVRAEVEDRGGAGLAGPWVEAKFQHDILDRLVSEALEITEGHFATRRTRYDRAGHAVLALSPLTALPPAHPDRQPAHVESLVYDERGLVTSLTRGGLTAQFRALEAHADIPELAAVPDAAERATVELGYDANGQLATETDAADTDGDGQREVTRFLYDGLDRLQSVVSPVGTQWLANYDPAGNYVRLRAFGPTGGPSPRDAAAATLDPPLGTATFHQPLLAESAARVNERGEAYMALDRLFAYPDVAYARPPMLAEGAADLPGDGWVETWREADRAGRTVAYREDDGHTYAFAYDGDDRLVLQSDPEGNTTAHTWDDAGNEVRTTTTEVSRPAEVAAGAAPRLRAQYDILRVYDALDRVIRVTDSLGNTGRWQYDSRGNAVRLTNAQHSSRATDLLPDPLGLFPVPGASAANGSRINRPGNVTTRAFDGLGRLVRETHELRAGGQGMGALDTANPANPDGLVTLAQAFDDASRLRARTDDLGNTTRLAYDALDRLVRSTHPDGAELRSDYDLDGNTIRHVDANGSELRVTYDAADRPLAVEVTRGAGVVGTTRQTQAFDGLGRMVESTDDNDPADAADDSRLTLAYDSLGRVLDEAADGLAVSSRWSGDGKRRLALIYPNGRTLTYGRDKLDLVTRVVDADGATLAQYRRLGPGRLLERPLANGVTWTVLDDARRLATGLDGLGRIVRQRHQGAAKQLVVGTTHGYDRQWVPSFEGKLHAPNLGESYTQDSLSRLVAFGRGSLNTAGGVTNPAPTGLRAQTWRLDGAGNWAETRRTVGAAAPTVELRSHSARNATTSVGATALGYDADGALLSDGRRGLAWDYAGRLRQVTLPGGQVVTYAYDGAGRRIARTTSGGPAIAPHTTRYTFDGWQEIEERSEAGVLLAQNVFGAWLDEPLIRDRDQDADGVVTGPPDLRLFYHQNTQYSVLGVTNRQGKLVEGYLYDPYGRPTVYTPGANGKVDFGGDDGVAPGGASLLGNPFLYTGRPWDAATGLYDLRRRQLDPVLGRFISPDPLGTWGDPANLGSAYAYVAGRPHWGLDPMGLSGYVKGFSNIKQQSAGDPVPGVVDSSLGQNPGGMVKPMAGKGIPGIVLTINKPPGSTPQAAGPGDPISGTGVGMEIFPPGGSMNAQSAGPGDPIGSIGVGLEIYPPGGSIKSQSAGGDGGPGRELRSGGDGGGGTGFPPNALAPAGGPGHTATLLPDGTILGTGPGAGGSSGSVVRIFSKFSLANKQGGSNPLSVGPAGGGDSPGSVIRLFSKFTLANKQGGSNPLSVDRRPGSGGLCPVPGGALPVQISIDEEGVSSK